MVLPHNFAQVSEYARQLIGPSTPPTRPRDSHFWSYANPADAYLAFPASNYAQVNPTQAWRREDVDEIRQNNHDVFMSYDHIQLGLEQRRWNSFWNDLTDHFRATLLRVENRVVQHYENNILAITTRSLIDANRQYRDSLRMLALENRSLREKNEELVQENITTDGKIFDLKKSLEK